jgi:16S rRNA C1402 (ribose-2'-O) methylase RsmI
VVILVEGFARADADIAPETWVWLERLAEELPPRRAAAVVAEVMGLPARDLYQWLLDQRRDT